jgi:hypothetical protein
VQYVFDDEVPPVPKRPNNFKPKPKVNYPFDLMDRNSSTRISGVALVTVRKHLYAYLKSERGRGKKFVSKLIAPNVVRVWRTV